MRYFHWWSFPVIFFSDATIKKTTKRKKNLLNSFPQSCFSLTETTLELICLAQHLFFSIQPKIMIALRMKQVYMIVTWCSMNRVIFCLIDAFKKWKTGKLFHHCDTPIYEFFLSFFLWYVDQRKKKISNKKTYKFHLSNHASRLQRQW